MLESEAWLSIILAVAVVFIFIFGGVIPVIILKKSRDDKELEEERAWANAGIAACWFVVACVAATFIVGVALKSGLIIFVGIMAFITLIVTAAITADSSDRGSEAYGKLVASAAVYFIVLALAPLLAIVANNNKEAERLEAAKYDQTITQYFDANNHKVEDETHTYPVSSLRTNGSGDTYTWVERQEDGTLATRRVQKVPDGNYEVAIKDDLPATDMEARVERSVEYQVKSQDVAAGKEVCFSKLYDADILSFLPVCEKDGTRAKFVKSRTIIHIPAGSVEKMVPVTNE